MKDATMQGAEETLAETTGMWFNITSTDVKHVFYRFIEMAITDVKHHGLIDEAICKCFEGLTQFKTMRKTWLRKRADIKAWKNGYWNSPFYRTETNLIEPKTAVYKEEMDRSSVASDSKPSVDANLSIIRWGKPRIK